MEESSEPGMRDMLVESAQRAFAELCTKETINAAEGGAWPEHLWNTVEELGFTRAAVSESQEGSGLGLADALALGRLAGRFAAPIPLGETIIAGWLLSTAGLKVPEGPLTFGPATRNAAVSLNRSGSGWVLRGSLRNVPWGSQAKRIALVIAAAEGLAVAAIDPRSAKVTEGGRNLAGEPRTRLDFDDAPVAASDVRLLEIATGSGIGPDAPLLYGALLRGQQMAGALTTARDLAVRYAGERIAFGKPLNKLQAVQQNLAVLAGQTAAANVAADMALEALDALASDGGLVAAIGLAKVRIGEAVEIGARLAHQAHGAIGFTYEHALHHATRRLWSWRDEFGNEAYWAQRIGRLIVEAGPEQLWNTVTKAAQL